MPRIAYSRAQQQEAVALATVIGAEAAADQLGIDARTVRKWSARAGKSPADSLGASSWQRLMDLALTRAESLVASGKLSAVAVATVAGIASRNAWKERSPDVDASVAARESFLDWLVASVDVPDDVDALDRAFGRVRRHLIRRANAEPGQPRRPAILAWFSGDPETLAGDVLDWAKSEVDGLGDLLVWHVRETARDEAEAVIAARAKVLVSSGMRPHEAADFARSISDDLEMSA